MNDVPVGRHFALQRSIHLLDGWLNARSYEPSCFHVRHRRDDGQDMTEVIGQLRGFRQSIFTKFFSHPYQEHAARVLFAEQMPANFQGAGWINVKCSCEGLFDLVQVMLIDK